MRRIKMLNRDDMRTALDLGLTEAEATKALEVGLSLEEGAVAKKLGLSPAEYSAGKRAPTSEAWREAERERMMEGLARASAHWKERLAGLGKEPSSAQEPLAFWTGAVARGAAYQRAEQAGGTAALAALHAAERANRERVAAGLPPDVPIPADCR
jgi:hypothetical protein